MNQATTPDTRRKGLAVTSLVLGILSLTCFSIFTGIPAIITGHVAHGRAKRAPAEYGGAGQAITGFVMGYVSLLLSPFIIAVLLAMLLPALAAAKHRAGAFNYPHNFNAGGYNSTHNLKEIGLAFHVWESEHNDQYPFNLSETNGGTLELCHPDSRGFEQNPAATLMLLSNELSTPKLLVCPNDPAKHAAADFASLTAGNISYVLRTGPDVNDRHPREVLMVDPINGYVLHCDGSVQRDLKYKQQN
jgi:hypothetical protein